MDDVTLAYLAGVIDSDGYITTTRGFHSGRMYSAAKIGIAGTRRQPHDLAASLFGGNVTSYLPANPRHRLQYQWTRSGKAAYVAIKAVLPHLRIKREQAMLAMELQEQVWIAPDLYPATLVVGVEDAHQAVRDLNQCRRSPLATA